MRESVKFGHSSRTVIERKPVFPLIKQRSDAIDLFPGAAAKFDFTIDVIVQSPGELDPRCLFIHCCPGRRFVYLRWGETGRR